MEVAFLKIQELKHLPFSHVVANAIQYFPWQCVSNNGTSIGKSCNCVQTPPQWLYIIIFMHSEDLTKQNENICFATVI